MKRDGTETTWRGCGHGKTFFLHSSCECSVSLLVRIIYCYFHFELFLWIPRYSDWLKNIQLPVLACLRMNTFFVLKNNASLSNRETISHSLAHAQVRFLLFLWESCPSASFHCCSTWTVVRVTFKRVTFERYFWELHLGYTFRIYKVDWDKEALEYPTFKNQHDIKEHQINTMWKHQKIHLGYEAKNTW